jgi:hypothetical protein
MFPYIRILADREVNGGCFAMRLGGRRSQVSSMWLNKCGRKNPEAENRGEY